MDPVISIVKAQIERGRDAMLNALKYVPEEKLNWAPAATAKSALRIAAHIAVTNVSLGNLIKHKTMKQSMTSAEIGAWFEAEEKKFTSRGQVVTAINESADQLLATVESLTEEDLKANVESPFGTRPMRQFMMIPGVHMMNHASQIEYLQTCWGDNDFHM